MMKISADTCAIFRTGVSRGGKKRNPGRLTDEYREEKFDVASLFFFPSRALLSIKVSNAIPTDMRSMQLSHARLGDKSCRGIQSRRSRLLAHRAFGCIARFYCAPMRFSRSIGIGELLSTSTVCHSDPSLSRKASFDLSTHSCCAITV
jgi:hypothetical protein